MSSQVTDLTPHPLKSTAPSAWFAILVTGRYRTALFVVEGVIRWKVRATAYALTTLSPGATAGFS
jgi:hypothetical protein